METSRNKDVFLNFGLIAYGPLSEIEKLQAIIKKECPKLNLIYQTVTARRLYLGKRRDYGKNVTEKKRDEQVRETSEETPI